MNKSTIFGLIIIIVLVVILNVLLVRTPHNTSTSKPNNTTFSSTTTSPTANTTQTSKQNSSINTTSVPTIIPTTSGIKYVFNGTVGPENTIIAVTNLGFGSPSRYLCISATGPSGGGVGSSVGFSVSNLSCSIPTGGALIGIGVENYSSFSEYTPSFAEEGIYSTSYLYNVSQNNNLVIIAYSCVGSCTLSNVSYLNNCIIDTNTQIYGSYSTYALACKDLPIGSYGINISYNPGSNIDTFVAVYH